MKLACQNPTHSMTTYWKIFWCTKWSNHVSLSVIYGCKYNIHICNICLMIVIHPSNRLWFRVAFIMGCLELGATVHTNTLCPQCLAPLSAWKPYTQHAWIHQAINNTWAQANRCSTWLGQACAASPRNGKHHNCWHAQAPWVLESTVHDMGGAIIFRPGVHTKHIIIYI